MTYDEVTEIFEEVVDDLRDLTSQNAPNTYTWLAPTLPELIEEVGSWPYQKDSGIAPNETVGESGKVIAFTYECNGQILTEILENADGEEVRQHFEFSTGLENAN